MVEGRGKGPPVGCTSGAPGEKSNGEKLDPCGKRPSAGSPGEQRENPPPQSTLEGQLHRRSNKQDPPQRREQSMTSGQG